MKTTITKLSLAFVSVLASCAGWSQCAEIVCPSNITAYADSGACSAILSYNAPQGVDACQSTADTLIYSGAIVQWTVPAGINLLTIETRGASGGNGNGGSNNAEGLGAVMIGDFAVTPGQVLNVLVGQNNNSGNGGGGGTFVVDAVTGNPLIIAGGGAGASGVVDWAGKHGQITTSGAAGGAGGGAGGTLGNGGAAGAPFSSGAGGGFFTNGADGWTGGSGGQAFVNGGAGGNVGFGVGGFGGGGNGSGNQVGGGGGGYSGGGAGSNSVGGGANGGGGGSINNGSNQVNSSGLNLGNGMVIFTSYTPAPTTLLAGLGSGGGFPVGTTTETYLATVSPTDTMTCSFTVTVFDTVAPYIDPISNVQNCGPSVSGIAATTIDYCGGEVITYTLSGATTGSGTGDAGASSFNTGVTTVWYYATDASGNVDSISFDVTVLPLPSVSLAPFAVDTLCDNNNPIPLPVGTPAGGIYTGSGVSGMNFDPISAGIGLHTIMYTITDSSGCEGTTVASIYVDNCVSVDELAKATGFNVYPNPSSGVFTVDFKANAGSAVKVIDVQGRVILRNSYNEGTVNDELNLGEVSKGIYFVEVTIENQKMTQRIIIE